MIKTLRTILLFSLSTVFVFLFFVENVLAVTAKIENNNDSVYQGQTFEVDLIVDTENKKINALEGEVAFDSDSLEFVRVNDGNSFVSFWIDSPSVVENGKIFFSGMTPGGIDKIDARVFSIVFKAKTSGVTDLNLDNFIVLENSENGNILDISYEDISIGIKKNDGVNTFEDLEVKDTVAPEDFSVILSRDQNIFDGKWFIAFGTQDKGSGISHFEICENGKLSCERGESPYLLKNQQQSHKIVVIAYDNAGNTTESFVYEKGFVLKIIVTIAIVFAILVVTLIYAKRRKLWWFKN